MASRQSNLERNDWTISLLDVQPTDRVLEIGFGPGVAIQKARQRAVDGLVAGVDHSEIMVRQARKRNAAAIQEGRVDVRLGSVTDLPSFDEPFDKIFSINSIIFWDDPVGRLRALREMMRPGGLIAITVQPRSPKATDGTAREGGLRIVARLTEAGFTQARLETRRMKPVLATCGLGVR